jgi:Uma2 family endonuclease
MQVVLPENATRASFELSGEDRPLNDEEFFDFCMRNPDLRIERLPNGEIVIMPPAGLETGYQNNEISRQLGNWALNDRRGVAFDSNTEFILASGAAFAPDAAWVLKTRLAQLTSEQKKKFGRLCPDFVIELRSASDRLATLKSKMDEWINNGARLGWLIDAGRRAVFIYRPGKTVEELRYVTSVEGEGPVEGFSLELEPIWRGL